MSKPPKTPWKKGIHDDYSSVVVEVPIARNELGQVYSYHMLQDEVDHFTTSKWPGGGQEQIAFALLVEAARREAIVQMLLCLSNDPGFKNRYVEDPDAVVEEMTTKLKSQLSNTLDNLGEGAVREALDRLNSPWTEPG